MANSRVGVKTSARIGCLAGEAPLLANGNNFCSSGNEKAAVLPVPVCAPAIKSPPANASGMACA